MNIRVVTYLSSENEYLIKELVADFSDALIARGFANDIGDQERNLKSLIIVKENVEVLDNGPDEFFASELADSLMTVIPTDEQPEEPEVDTRLIQILEDDGA